MTTNQTVAQIMQKHQRGETLTSEEAEQAAAYFRDEVSPAVQKAAAAFTAAFKPVFDNLNTYFKSAEGQQLIAVARQWEAQNNK